MKVEVDQSGRLEHLDTDTVIAYANGKNGAVLVKVSTKRYLIQGLKRTIIPHDRLMPYLFAVCIFLLVRDLDKRVVLEIDEEYTRKDDIVSETLSKCQVPLF
jgi:hypothetical protein